MPKRLAILRHAKSSWDQPGVTDFDRPLNERGRIAAPIIGRVMAGRGLLFDLILASPAARTRETLERLEGVDAPVRWEPELYLASADRLMAFIREIPEKVDSALIIGHNPGLQQLVVDLGRRDRSGHCDRAAVKFPTAALALIDLNVDSWSEAGAGCGTIVELLLPRDLD